MHQGSAGADPGLGERQHRGGDGASGDFSRDRLAPERGPIHPYGRILTADEKARHVVLPRRGLVRRKREAEWVAQPAPGQLHIEVVGADSLGVGAPWIARCFDAVKLSVAQVLETCEAAVRAEIRYELRDEIAGESLVVVQAVVRPIRRRTVALWRLKEHQRMAPTMRR